MRYLIIFVFLLTGNVCQAQLSFSLESGYQFKMGSTKLSDGIPMMDQNGNQGVAIVQYSFGQGYNFVGDAMVHLNDNLQVGVKVSYLLGQSILGYIDTRFQSRMLRFIPQVKFKLGGDRLSAFTTVGFIIGKGGFTEKFESVEATRIFEYSEGISYGINNAIGIEYQTNTRFSYFLKLDSYIQSYGPKRRAFTTYRIGEVDILPSLNTIDKEVEYVDFLINGIPAESDMPDQKLRRIYPFSSVGVSIGVVVMLLE